MVSCQSVFSDKMGFNKLFGTIKIGLMSWLTVTCRSRQILDTLVTFSGTKGVSGNVSSIFITSFGGSHVWYIHADVVKGLCWPSERHKDKPIHFWWWSGSGCWIKVKQGHNSATPLWIFMQHCVWTGRSYTRDQYLRVWIGFMQRRNINGQIFMILLLVKLDSKNKCDVFFKRDLELIWIPILD